MAVPVDESAVIAPGALLLVTGANGYLGCRFAKTAINRGYKVRGVVRSKEQCSHIQDFFDGLGVADSFEMVEVPDLTVEGALDEAVKGCAGLAHFAVDNSFKPNPEVIVKGSVAMTTRALEAAAKEPGLKRVVLASSFVTANQFGMTEPYDITQDSWNQAFVAMAWSPPPNTPEHVHSLFTYAAAKVESEQALWNFVKEKKPSFVANTILPDFVTGASMPHAKPNVGPQSFMMEALWNGGELWKLSGPSWMIDAEDTSLLHLGALLHPDYKGERIFGCGHPKSWADWIPRLRTMYPDHTFPDPPEGEGQTLTRIVDQPRAEGLLKWLGQESFRPAEESIKEVFDTMA